MNKIAGYLFVNYNGAYIRFFRILYWFHGLRHRWFWTMKLVWLRYRWQELRWMLSGKRRCPWCYGDGKILNSYDVRECEVCNGKGTLPWRR